MTTTVRPSSVLSRATVLAEAAPHPDASSWAGRTSATTIHLIASIGHATRTLAMLE